MPPSQSGESLDLEFEEFSAFPDAMCSDRHLPHEGKQVARNPVLSSASSL